MKRSEEEIIYRRREGEKMKIFFLMCWTKMPRKSEIGPEYKKFYGEPLSIYYHHCFEKSPYPELKYSYTNILRVTSDEHFNLNSDPDFYLEARNKKKYIKENWQKCIEESKNFEKMFEKLKNNM